MLLSPGAWRDFAVVLQFREYPPVPEDDFSGLLVMRRKQGYGFVRLPAQYGGQDRLMFVGHVP